MVAIIITSRTGGGERVRGTRQEVFALYQVRVGDVNKRKLTDMYKYYKTSKSHVNPQQSKRNASDEDEKLPHIKVKPGDPYNGTKV